jgi:hypothetical protein
VAVPEASEFDGFELRLILRAEVRREERDEQRDGDGGAEGEYCNAEEASHGGDIICVSRRRALEI